jgi:hypothetical protein
MPFAAGLRESLQSRRTQVRAELTGGQSLKHVLAKQLLAVEAMSDPELITSILLLSHDGKRLSHGAAPRLPQAYCDVIDGSEIGPSAGSCGTAAFHGRPVYVSDIATDPLWADYRHLALPHGLKSCWSTPIRDSDGAVIGTFAIYRPTVGDPTHEEIAAIAMISDHVAQAILLARDVQDFEPPPARPAGNRPALRLVSSSNPAPAPSRDRSERLLALAARLQSKAADLTQLAKDTESREATDMLDEAAALSRQLAKVLRAEAGDQSNARGRE